MENIEYRQLRFLSTVGKGTVAVSSLDHLGRGDRTVTKRCGCGHPDLA
jgi:hypothetical protein